MTKICPTCKQPFDDPKHPNRVYCSKQCHFERFYETVTCPGCGKEFRKRHGQDKKYCAAECAFKHRQSRPRYARKQCVCEWCGKSFETWQSRPGRFCSKSCTAHYAGSVSPGGPRKPDSFVTLLCEFCGKSHTVHRIFNENGRTSRYCSLACRGKASSIRMRGAGNHNFKGYPVNDRGPNWLSQRRKALRRDGYHCQICGKGKTKRRRLDVHHIKPYRDFGGDYETANHLSNLITLCRPCHVQVEHHDLPCPVHLL